MIGGLVNRFKKWWPNAGLIELQRYFRGLKEKETFSEQVVLVQCSEDIYFFGIFGQIASSLRKNTPIRVEQYIYRCLNVGESRSILGFIASRFLINPLNIFKWRRLYNSFCDRVAYNSTSVRPMADINDAISAWRSWKELTDKPSLINLTVNHVEVGDLVNDSYLRYKPAPTVDLKDFYLFLLIWQAYRAVRRARTYFLRVRPWLFLTSYSTYIQHGVPVRVALQNRVKVFSFGNYQEFAKELSLQDWVHTKNPDQYAEGFLKLDKQDERMGIAEQALMSRLSGGIDSATVYMRKSAYEITTDTVPDVKDAVVIFLHDFYDSPHVYRRMVFHDFWEWICFTIETLQTVDIKFFIKPHPNQIRLSDSVLEKLEQRYPNLAMISSSITNKQLAEAGMACAVTVYGTVAHEMAFLGVPSIACAQHPHISFEFCRTAKNKDEYSRLLLEYDTLPEAKAKLKRQSLIFYYMHNLNIDVETEVLRDAANEYRMACNTSDERKDIVKLMHSMTELSGYRAMMAGLLA